MSLEFPNIAPPDPVRLAVLAGQVRAVMPLIGGIVGTLGVTLPAYTDTQLSAYIRAVIVLFGVVSWAWAAIWSRRQKHAADRAKRQAEVAAAVASAAAGKPVTITITPQGQDNIPVLVRESEARIAEHGPAGVEPMSAPLR